MPDQGGWGVVSSVPEGAPQAKGGWNVVSSAPLNESPYTTTLSPGDEAGFQSWVKANKVPWQDEPRADYDMRGYYKGLRTGDPIAKQSLNAGDGLMHFPDKWKTPYHKTFSNESMYALPDAPHWEGDRLIDKNGKVVADETPKPQKPTPFAAPQQRTPLGIISPQDADALTTQHAKMFETLRSQLEAQPPGVPLRYPMPQSVPTPFGPGTMLDQLTQAQPGQGVYPDTWMSRLSGLGGVSRLGNMFDAPPVDLRGLQLEAAVPGTGTPSKIARGVIQGTEAATTGFLTPKNLALMTATFGAGGVPVLNALVSGGFALDSIWGAAQQYPQLREQISRGDVQGAAQTLTSMGIQAGMGVAAGLHGVKSAKAAAGEFRARRGTAKAAAPAAPEYSTTGQRPGERPPAQTPAAPAQRIEPTPPLLGKPKLSNAALIELLKTEHGPKRAALVAMAKRRGLEIPEVARKGAPGPEMAKLAHYQDLFDQADARMSEIEKQRRPPSARKTAPPATVPETGVPENVARVVEKRRTLTQEFFPGKEFFDLKASARESIDDLIREGFGHPKPPSSERAKRAATPAQTPAAPAQPTTEAKEKEAHAEPAAKPEAIPPEPGPRTGAPPGNAPGEPADTGRKPHVEPQQRGERAPAVAAASERPAAPALATGAEGAGAPVDEGAQEVTGETPAQTTNVAPGILDRLSAAGKESEKWLRDNGITGGSLSANRVLDPEVLFHLTRAVAGDVARGAITIRDAAQRIGDQLREKFSDVPPVGVIEGRIRDRIQAARPPVESGVTEPSHTAQVPVDAAIAPYFEKGTEDFRGRPRAALAWVRRTPTAFAAGAIEHPEIPNGIGLLHGESGDSGFGVAHVDEQRPGYLDDAIESIRSLPVVEAKPDPRTGRIMRKVLSDGQRRAVVSLDLRGHETPEWLLTAYERPASAAISSVSGTPKGAAPTPAAAGREAPSAGGYPVVPGSPQSAPQSGGRPPSGGSDSSVTPAAPKPGTIAQIPTADIHVDPVRFQFKQNVGQKGVGEELKSVETFDPELAGIVSVWHDPADGKTYVVNGHHRVELAQRTGYPQMTVRYLDAENAAQARAKGAFINIAEGRGTPLDAAKIFRDTNATPEALQKKGISMKGAIARQGMGLANLDQRIFDLVAQGEIPVETAAVIGEMLPERDADQRAVVDMIDKAAARGKKMSPGEIREAIRVGMRPDQQLTETQETLFGDITQRRGLFAETGEISEYIRKKLNQEKRLFGSVGSESSAARLAGAGNVIKAEENQRIADAAAQAIAVYDKLSAMSGPVSDAIAAGARDLAGGGNAHEIKERTYEAVRGAISQTLAGANGPVSPGLPGRGEGGGDQTGAGEPHPAAAEKEEENPNLGLFGSERGAISPRLLNALSLGLGKFVAEDVVPSVRDAAEGIAETAGDIRRVLFPTLMSKEAQTGSFVMREKGSEMARRYDQARKALDQAWKLFERSKRDDNLEFMDRVETGQKQPTPELQTIADTLRDLLDGRRRDVQSLGTGKLQKFYEDYFPHIWKRPRKADNWMAEFFGKRPFEGSKAFLKQRTLPTIKDGIAKGLEPVSDNPVELTLRKLREMDKFIMAQRTLKDWKGRGLAKFVDARKGKAPKGWRKIVDPIGAVYGPSVQNISEYPNEGLWKGLNDVANALGIKSNRGFIPMRGAAGRAYKGKGLVQTLHGTAEDVLAHEIGHQIDWLAGSGSRFVENYPDPQTAGRIRAARLTLRDPNATPAQRASARAELKALAPAIAERVKVAKELRDLADLRAGGSQAYRRSREEKMAQLAQMWAGARPLFEKTAPTVFREWKKFLDANPKLHALRDLQASANVTQIAQPYDVGGLVIRGNYYAPEGAARILNNYLSPGLSRYAGYRGLMGLNSLMNQFQLGMSAFHLGFVATDSTISKLALANESLLRGKPIQAIKYAAQTPTAAFTTLLKGDRMLREWYKPGSQGAEIGRLVDAAVTAGARAGRDPFYQTNLRANMMAAFRKGNTLGGVLRAPFVPFEALTEGIMGGVVPRMKLGVFADMARLHLEQLGPNASEADVQRALVNDWNSVENRLGEMTYENLFWNRLLKDSAMLGMRSVGWNLGTLREIGGGIADVAAQPANKLRGKPVNLNRLSYLLALVQGTAAISAIYQYLHTRKGPEELKDYFFPKNGQLDEQGRPQRSSPPTYTKDLYHYATHPGKTIANKIAPIWGAAAEIWRNKDFYGNKIRNEGDPLVEQFKEAAEYAAKQFVPIAARTAQRERTLGSPTSTQIEQFFGMTPAPSDINQTPAEALASDLAAARTGDEPGRPADAAERRDLRTGLTRAVRAQLAAKAAGNRGIPKLPQETRDAIKAGKLSTRDIREAYRTAHQDPLQNQFSHLTIGDALKVYRAATADERAKLRGMLLKKGKAALKSEPPTARIETLRGLREALAVH